VPSNVGSDEWKVAADKGHRTGMAVTFICGLSEAILKWPWDGELDNNFELTPLTTYKLFMMGAYILWVYQKTCRVYS